MTNTDPTISLDTFLDGSAEVAALLTSAAQQAVLPRKLEEGIYATLNPAGGIEIHETEGYAEKRKLDWELARAGVPEFIKRGVTLLDVGSFIDYLAHNTADTGIADAVNASWYAHGTGELELWANIDSRSITAILNGYNGNRDHTAKLALKTSREWNEWTGIDGQLVTQVQFAEFIQDHISTIADPNGALLVDICETLVGKTDVAWKSGQISSNGQRQFVYEETVEGKAGVKGDLSIPTELTLVLRPFQGSEPVAIKARFRFRANNGGLVLGVKLVEPERVLETGFNEVVAAVQGKVPVHVNHGTF